MYCIEDDLHAESIGEFWTIQEAWSELRRLAGLPWDQEPNVAPCMGWEQCGRHYEIVEYDVAERPWTELRRAMVLEVSAKEVRWVEDPRAKGSFEF